MNAMQDAGCKMQDDWLTLVPTDALVAELARRRAMIDKVLEDGPDPEVVRVVRAVAEAWRMHPTRLFRRERSQPTAEARQAAMVLLRRQGMTFEAIGAAFHLDHGTAMHAWRTQAARMMDGRYAARFAAAAGGGFCEQADQRKRQ